MVLLAVYGGVAAAWMGFGIWFGWFRWRFRCDVRGEASFEEDDEMPRRRSSEEIPPELQRRVRRYSWIGIVGQLTALVLPLVWRWST